MPSAAGAEFPGIRSGGGRPCEGGCGTTGSMCSSSGSERQKRFPVGRGFTKARWINFLSWGTWDPGKILVAQPPADSDSACMRLRNPRTTHGGSRSAYPEERRSATRHGTGNRASVRDAPCCHTLIPGMHDPRTRLRFIPQGHATNAHVVRSDRRQTWCSGNREEGGGKRTPPHQTSPLFVVFRNSGVTWIAYSGRCGAPRQTRRRLGLAYA